ncbi:MAG: ABC transporter ATP-binding protein [Candidatus Hodarchaeales archaeon]|jgi:putative ABC transport system ATP-binding protein
MRKRKMDSFVEIKDLTKQYMTSADIPLLALRNLSLDVYESEICTIMGPSGCGKTTLLNMVGGIDYPTSGFIRVGDYYMTSPEMMPTRFGFKATPHTEYRRNSVGFIFQLHNLSPIHNAVENVELPMIFAGVQRETRKRQAIELLEYVGLSERIDHRIDALSGGERQRVAVASAFANKPKLILADEPTGELDREGSKMLCDLFLHLKEVKDFTMILVTHNPQVALIGNRILEMRDGAIKGEIPKKTIIGASYLPSDAVPSDLDTTDRPFPPSFCTSCGANVIITPKMSDRTGMWMENASGKKTEIEFEFAQCAKCGELFWQPAKISLKDSKL